MAYGGYEEGVLPAILMINIKKEINKAKKHESNIIMYTDNNSNNNY